jgi:hypothetical protein
VENIEHPEIKAHNYTHLIFDKEAKNIHLLQQMVLGKLVYPVQNTEIRPQSLLHKNQVGMDQRS